MLRTLFLIPFWVSLWLLLTPIYALWATQNWLPIKAVVTYSTIETKSVKRGAAVSRLAMHYSYTYQGKTFQGYRSGLGNPNSYDNFDEHWKRQQVKVAGSEIMVYVNPTNPSHSLANRSLRWSILGFGLGFVVVWGLSWWAFFGRHKDDDVIDEKHQFVSMRMVVLFNAIGWLALAAVWSRLLEGFGAIWLVVMFPTLGLYLAYLRFQQRSYREFAQFNRSNLSNTGRYQTGEQIPIRWSATYSLHFCAASLVIFTLWWQFPRSFEGLQEQAQRTKTSRSDDAQKKIVAQYQRDLPSQPQPFALEDSSFAFVALGSGRVSPSSNGFTLSSDGLRLQFRADCPSDLCVPIRLLRWMMVVPTDLAKPDGAWTTIAESAPQLIDFSPLAKNAQVLVPAQNVQLQALRAGRLQQARLMVGLYSTQTASTYSQSNVIWPKQKVSEAIAEGLSVNDRSGQNTASKSAQSLYAALFYADAEQTRQHIAKGANVNETYDNSMGTVHVAAFSGCVDCLIALANAGANLNYKVTTYRQENALMLAIRNQQVSAAKKLLELGADPCQTDREGYNAQGWVQFYKLQNTFSFVPTCAK